MICNKSRGNVTFMAKNSLQICYYKWFQDLSIHFLYKNVKNFWLNLSKALEISVSFTKSSYDILKTGA